MTSGGAISPLHPKNPQQAQHPQHRDLSNGIALRLRKLKPQQRFSGRNMAAMATLRLLRAALRLVAARAKQESPMEWALLRLLRLLRLSRRPGKSTAASAPSAKVRRMGRSGPLPMATRRSGYTPSACASFIESLWRRPRCFKWRNCNER